MTSEVEQRLTLVTADYEQHGNQWFKMTISTTLQIKDKYL